MGQAAILQQTSDYIYQLLQEKNKLVTYNNQLKRMLTQNGGDAAAAGSYSSPQSPSNDVPTVIKRRKTVDGKPCDILAIFIYYVLCSCLHVTGALESADEGIGSMSPEHISSDEARAEILDLRRETMEMRLSLERERRHRISLEEHIAILQQQQSYSTRKQDHERYDFIIKFLLHFITN